MAPFFRDCFAEFGHSQHIFGMQMASKYNDLTIDNVNGLPNKKFLLENQFQNGNFFIAINKIYILIYVFVTFYWFVQPKTTVKD